MEVYSHNSLKEWFTVSFTTISPIIVASTKLVVTVTVVPSVSKHIASALSNEIVENRCASGKKYVVLRGHRSVGSIKPKHIREEMTLQRIWVYNEFSDLLGTEAV